MPYSPTVSAPPTTARTVWLAAAVVALLGLVPLVLATPDGLGVSPDSTQYLAAARSLVRGNGLLTIWWSGHAEPLTHFPPLYPLMIALVSFTGVSVERAAWFIELFLLPTNVLLTAWLTSRIAGGTAHQRAIVALSAAMAVAVATNVVSVHAMMWSEPLFLAFLLLSFGFAATSVARSRDGFSRSATKSLVVAACLASLAVLTRYVGVVLLGTTALAIVGYNVGTLRSRLARAFLFGAIASAPISLWIAYNSLRGLSPANRELAFHPISVHDLLGGIIALSHWLSPYAPWTLLRIATCAVTIVGVVLVFGFVRRHGPRRLTESAMRGHLDEDIENCRPDGFLALLLASFVLLYAAFVIISISIADRSTELSDRILFPLFPLTIALVVSVLAIALRGRDLTNSQWSRRSFPVSVSILFVGFVASQTLGLVAWVRDARRHGLGLAAVTRAAPQLIAEVRALPDSARVYSNMPYEIYFATGRTVLGIPRRQSPTSLLPNAHLESDFAAIGDSLAPRTYLVYFDAGNDQTFLATHTDVDAHVKVIEGKAVVGGHIDEVIGTARDASGSPHRHALAR